MILNLSDAEARYYDAPPARDMPDWATDTRRRIERATLADFGSPATEDDAAYSLLFTLGLDVDNMAGDILDQLLDAAYSRWCAVSR